MSSLRLAKGYAPYETTTPIYANGKLHVKREVFKKKETLCAAAERFGMSRSFFTHMSEENKQYLVEIGGDIITGYEKFLVMSDDARRKIAKIRSTLSRLKSVKRFSIFIGIEYTLLHSMLKRHSKKIRVVNALDDANYIIEEYKKFKDIL